MNLRLVGKFMHEVYFTAVATVVNEDDEAIAYFDTDEDAELFIRAKAEQQGRGDGLPSEEYGGAVYEDA